MKKKNILLFSLIAILFAGLGVVIGQRHTEPAPAAPSAVNTLLSQAMKDASGETHPLAQWKGRPLVVNFWATWCAPCVEEMPELAELQAEIAPQGIQILGIGIDTPSNIAEFTSKYKIGYPLYVGGAQGTELSRQLGNKAGGLPFTVLIGRDGEVKKTYLGRLKMDELRGDLKGL